MKRDLSRVIAWDKSRCFSTDTVCEVYMAILFQTILLRRTLTYGLIFSFKTLFSNTTHSLSGYIMLSFFPLAEADFNTLFHHKKLY
jgi:hypothetical protein